VIVNGAVADPGLKGIVSFKALFQSDSVGRLVLLSTPEELIGEDAIRISTTGEFIGTYVYNIIPCATTTTATA